MATYGEIWEKYVLISHELAALQRRKADLSIELTRINQRNLVAFKLDISESPQEEESLTGSEQPD